MSRLARAHPASYPVCTGGPLPGDKARPGRDADYSPLLVPKSRMSSSYTPVRLSACVVVMGQLYIFISSIFTVESKVN
jgi:hypothetical protein